MTSAKAGGLILDLTFVQLGDQFAEVEAQSGTDGPPSMLILVESFEDRAKLVIGYAGS